MDKAHVAQQLRAAGVIGVIRIQQEEEHDRILEALRRGGITCLEITMTSPGALGAMERASASITEDLLLGAGTVLDAPTARQAILAGARFLVTPTVRPDVLEMAHRYGVLAIIGAFTPTEMLTAWEAGADLVKLFPASVMGANYLREIRGPLPQIPIIPTGGVTDETAGAFIRAGAAAVCAGSWLVDGSAISEGRYDELTRRARALIDVVRGARGGGE